MELLVQQMALLNEQLSKLQTTGENRYPSRQAVPQNNRQIIVSTVGSQVISKQIAGKEQEICKTMLDKDPILYWPFDPCVFSHSSLPIIDVLMNNVKMKALLDTGATMNILSLSIFNKIRDFLVVNGSQVELKTITGLTIYSDTIICVNMNINDTCFKTQFVVAGTDLSPTFDLILSQNFFQCFNFVLDCKSSVLRNDVVSVSWNFHRMFPSGNSANSLSDDFSKQKLNSDQFLDNEKCDIEMSSVNSITGRMVTKIQIPAFSQKYVEIKLDDNCNAFTVDQPILVESLNDKHSDSFLIARSVSNLDVKNRCVALVCNLNDSPVNLNKNMALVKISPIHKVACIENVNNVSSEKSKRQIDWATQVDLNHLEDEQKLKVMNLLSKYNSVSAQNISDLGQCDLIKHEIHLSDQIPVRQKPYRVPYHLKPEMRSQINVLLEAWIIQASTSSFSAPVILVKKSDGSYRLVADLRKLNAKTVPDNYPLPNLTEMIDNLSGAKLFSTLDLTSGFHQMVMKPDHTKYTAIATEFGLFEYKRLLFGLRNASASFQRLMNLVLAGLNEFQISCYIDDLVIAAGSFDEYLAKLEMVFQRLQKANLKVKPSKCSFLKDQITYLGHTVREGQVYPDKKNLDSIREALPPKTKRQVRSFLGLTRFYRKFIPKYSEIALPLT
ncbi:Retrovirus-related Pol polyprotein from transposon 17.6 [Araneus ventricosus]|uniref:Retrovirus-related Pol polyprotein from transposon 17.6 n=1 Tax=Araneus ventricosus TaxID=182803 RepID=A0A4Y2WH35_ARAVE|nr:Retrovirus-related Pol polyprotein from transposon 17.6 [Araneus ventricosus]